MSQADMCGAQANVRFGSKADMCGAKGHVRFGPIADIISSITSSAVLNSEHRTHLRPFRSACDVRSPSRSWMPQKCSR
jgi:hypothetical protein